MVREGEETSNRAFKVRIYPTKKQIRLIHKNMQAARIAYNYAVACSKVEYEAWGKAKHEFKDSLKEKGLKGKKFEEAYSKFCKENKGKYTRTAREIRKKWTELKNSDEKYFWMKECDSCAVLWGIDLFFEAALKRYNKGLSKFPRFKKFKEGDSYPTCISVDKLDNDRHKIFIPKLGWVKTSPNQEFPYFIYPSKNVGNPIVLTDGVGYYVSFGYYRAYNSIDKPKTDIIGIDLGMKNLAILSNGEIMPNLADDRKVQRLERQIKKIQKQISKLINKGKSVVYRPYVISKEELEAIPKNLRGKKLAELARERNKLSTNKVRKLYKLLRKKQIQVNNRKSNLRHEFCERIVQQNPAGIVFENLNVKGMQQNKKNAPKLQKTGMYSFKECMKWHAKKHNIEVREADRFFPSSQECSKCGYINKEMKDLSKRTFVCPECGNTLDRDLNAAMNLKRVWEESKVI